jgi:hypothetical protein
MLCKDIRGIADREQDGSERTKQEEVEAVLLTRVDVAISVQVNKNLYGILSYPDNQSSAVNVCPYACGTDNVVAVNELPQVIPM